MTALANCVAYVGDWSAALDARATGGRLVTGVAGRGLGKRLPICVTWRAGIYLRNDD